ncbi:MAG: T9SS type A sorting domain-containing protein, partial [Terrimonas sp.]|nr:T9SS type A sorting domain-containing protein [Terrimonas sp.]
IASASTYASSVYINFNTEDPAASPWNNTNQNPITGAFYGYFLNDEKIYSGISMTVGDGFSGSNPFGENTGNDIGVVPDNVMRSTWWVDISQGSELKFSGLARNMVYRFTFFASREGTDSRVSTFTINGNKVKLKVSGNRYQTVTIDNVYADQNGEVIVAIRGEGSSGYIGGIIISSAKIPSTPVDGAAGESFRQQNNADATSVVAPENTATSSSAKIYPNPFTSDLMLKLTLKSETQKLNIKVTDPLGRVVFLRELKNLRSGSTVQSLGLDKIRLQAGVYVISIYNDDGYLLPPVKVLKNK